MALTGPPRIDGTVLPRASEKSPVQVQWTDESPAEEYRSGRHETVDKRLRGQITMGWGALDESDFTVLTASLRKAEFDVTPRTAQGSEEPADEKTYRCRCVSDIPEEKPLYRDTYSIEVELETIHLYDETQTKIT